MEGSVLVGTKDKDGRAQPECPQPERDDNAGWRAALGELALACAGSPPAEDHARLRELARLLSERPGHTAAAGLALPADTRFEPLLTAGATESAALALFGGGAGYILSRGAGGQHLASVVLAGSDAEVTAGGDSLVLALVGALSLALAEAESLLPLAAAPRSPDGSRLN